LKGVHERRLQAAKHQGGPDKLFIKQHPWKIMHLWGFDKRTAVEFPPKITIATPRVFAMLVCLFTANGGRKRL
jgi:hypothetical protein